MDEYLHLKIYHIGEFIDEEFSVYKGGEVLVSEVEVDMWSYFKLLGCFKELGYSGIDKIYYRDPTFGMNMLVDDKGALEIVDLYRVHLSVNIDIQHSLSQPEYSDGPLNEIEVDHDDNVGGSEEVLAAMYEKVINGELKGGELKEVGMKESEANETVLKESEANKDEFDESEENEVEENHDNMHDECALEIALDDEFDEYDDELVKEDELANLIDYVHEHYQHGNNKKGNKSGKKTRKNLKGVIMKVSI
ncbi:unnamed protein product [Lathyrus oleraceus]